jgi:hypothetical protein
MQSDITFRGAQKPEFNQAAARRLLHEHPAWRLFASSQLIVEPCCDYGQAVATDCGLWITADSSPSLAVPTYFAPRAACFNSHQAFQLGGDPHTAYVDGEQRALW